MSNSYTEDHLVEQPAIQLMQHELGWDVVNCWDEWNLLRQGDEGQGGGLSALGREGKREVVLTERLKSALLRLNPDLPMEAIDGAVEEISRDRSALSLVEANREIDKHLKGGVKVSFPDVENGGQWTEMVRVIDWQQPENNDFLLASQLWVAGELYLKRSDLVGFVNGLPLVLIELKKPGVNVREAFDKNLCDYKETIPQLFHYNALLLVSNGVQSKIGSLTAKWEHFGDWKKAASEEEVSEISLETLLRGTCEKGRLLDLVENFIRFVDGKGESSKLLARNHQFHGVNRAIKSLVRLCHPEPTLTPALSQGEKEEEVGKATSHGERGKKCRTIAVGFRSRGWWSGRGNCGISRHQQKRCSGNYCGIVNSRARSSGGSISSGITFATSTATRQLW